MTIAEKRARALAKSEGERILSLVVDLSPYSDWKLSLCGRFGDMCTILEQIGDSGIEIAEASVDLLSLAWNWCRHEAGESNEQILKRYIRFRSETETPSFRIVAKTGTASYSLLKLLKPLSETLVGIQSRQDSIRKALTFLLWVWTWHRIYILKEAEEDES